MYRIKMFFEDNPVVFIVVVTIIITIIGGEGKLYTFGVVDPNQGRICKICNGTGSIPKPTYTAVAIGPDLCERIDPITKGLKLL